MAGPKRTLSVDLGGLVLPTPIMIASGCGGTGRELTGLVDLRGVGAIVSRSITMEPRKGSPTPRITETPSGVVWDTGLQNPGLEAFVRDELPRLSRGVRAIVSVAGGSLEEYVRLTSGLQGRQEVSGIEVYLSGPDDELRRPVLGTHVDRVTEIVGAIARMAVVPVFAKLPPGGDTVELARAAVRAGASGVTLLASPPALGVDDRRLRPTLGGVTGWLSGPALRPLTLRAVFEVARAMPDVPILAAGGARTGSDAIELVLAGAWAVQVGTATLVDPAAAVDIATDVGTYLEQRNLSSAADIRGRIRVPASFSRESEA